VSVGDEIGSGDKIGTVGDDGSGSRVYFELRVGNTAVDPAAWFGI
jgi:septal ring factor EnvC (AmiA/AmiB activator)